MHDTTEPPLPRHLGFILDGNRRWAKMHGLPTYEGHLAGYHALKEVTLEAIDCGVQYVSLYAFSTENWKRSKDEVDGLMGLALRLFKTDIEELIREGVRVRLLGSRENMPPKLLDAIDETTERSRHLTRGTVAICFNYGGQDEITEALRQCIRDGLAADDITPEAISRRLYAPDVPPVDMVVRTSGEQRISNFMLWRTAYSELMFLDKPWPDMQRSDVHDIIQEYKRRNRRFGGN